jgi:DNA-binding response OmpR family regulator
MTRREVLREIETVPDFDDGRLVIHPERLMAYGDGRVLVLTSRELALLVELRRHPGKTRTRAQLIEAVWGRPGEVSARAVDVLVLRLRDKLEEAIPDVTYIHTAHGIGYGFDPQFDAEWDDR